MLFRYIITPKESKKTNVFKPAVNADEGEGQSESAWRQQTIGAAFVGNMNKVIANPRASVVWEARFF